MDKARRNELAKLKQKKRKKNYKLDQKEGYYYFKSTGKPCSCIFCQPQGKYRDNRRSKTKQEDESKS